MSSKKLMISVLALSALIATAMMMLPLQEAPRAQAQIVGVRICEPDQKLELERNSIALSIRCTGDRKWELSVNADDVVGQTINLTIQHQKEDGTFRDVMEFSTTVSNNLAKRELKIETENGDLLEVEIKFTG